MFSDERPRIDHNCRSLGNYIGRSLRSIITSLVDKTRARFFEHLAHVYLCCNNESTKVQNPRRNSYAGLTCTSVVCIIDTAHARASASLP